MKSTIKLAFVALVIALASCTSKPAENTATETDSVATETPAAEPAAVDTAATAPVDSAAVK